MHPAKDILTFLPSKVALALVGFVTIPLITRLFEPREYGNYILAMGLVRVMQLTAAWLSATIVRFYPEYEVKQALPELCGTIARMSLVWLTTVAVVYAGILLLMGNHIDGELRHLFWLSLPLFLGAASFDTLLEFLRARRKLATYSSFVIWRAIAAPAMGIFMAVGWLHTVDALMYGAILCLGVTMPVMWKGAWGGVAVERGRLSWGLAKELTCYGVPSLVADLSAWVMTLSDRYMLGHFRNSAEVGIYAASFSLSEYSLSMIASLVGLTSGSIVFHLWEKEGEAQAKAFMTHMARYLLIVSVPAVVGLSLLAEPIISLITAKQYHAGYKIVPFVVAGAFFLGLQQRYHAGINIVRKNHLLMISILTGASLNVGLNWVFIPHYGYFAAAGAMTVSNIVLFVMVGVLSRRHLVWAFPFATLFRTCLAALLMGVAVVGIRSLPFTYLWVKVAVAVSGGAGLYFAALYLLGEHNFVLFTKSISMCAFRKGGVITSPR